MALCYVIKQITCPIWKQVGCTLLGFLYGISHVEGQVDCMLKRTVKILGKVECQYS